MTRRTNRFRFPIRVAVAAMAVLLTACSAETAQRSGETVPTGGSSMSPTGAPRLSGTLPDDPVRMVLPASGAETRWTQGLDVFVEQVSRTATASCAREHSIALPEQAPLAFIRFLELPDLDFIARHGTSASAVVPTPAPGPATARAAAPAELRRCGAEGKAAARALRDYYAPLQQQWFSELVSLRHNPATVRALRTLPDCFARHGIRARDENGFFALADTLMQTAAPSDLPRVERELGLAYATCMRPVEAVREPARERLRTSFLTDHAGEIRALRRILVPALRRAEELHDVRLVFPVP
ncbi:hypothetical protein GCM10019016_104430 [Streptomyces prasinosporus]|uniref:Lipoprotein n=1 Tax=Streptomyces prasinosporus TaxID=68256 RepID=A0ABP6U9C5_9ACTN